jgi:hypothetical protein
MAKAHLKTPEGVTINVEGTPKEIAAIVETLKKQSAAPQESGRRAKGKPGRVLLVDLIGSLRDGGFFRKPQDLASIKGALAEMGHHYPVTTLSPIMLKLVRKREFRRLSEKGRWVYTS